MNKVIWLQAALSDVRQVSAYIKRENPKAAKSVGKRIREAAEKLSPYSELGRKGEVAGTRELVIPGLPYIIIYRVRENSVEILAVIHGKQKWL